MHLPRAQRRELQRWFACGLVHLGAAKQAHLINQLVILQANQLHGAEYHSLGCCAFNMLVCISGVGVKGATGDEWVWCAVQCLRVKPACTSSCWSFELPAGALSVYSVYSLHPEHCHWSLGWFALREPLPKTVEL